MRAEKFPLVLLIGALAFHGWGISVGWNHGNLVGNEFRQTQTAITALFIQRENNFSLAYPTPVLGKPWSVPFEFPLYQWSVVGLSRATGLSLVSAARTISALCFYLSLPAIWLLLRRIKVPPTGCALVLSLVLTCPLHILYARAFLIETMALMFGLWFLLAYVTVLKRPSFGWLVVANLAGAGAGLVKVTTFLVYLLPAFAWTLRAYTRATASPAFPLPWRDWRALTLRALGAVAVPFAVTLLWIHFTDTVKAQSPLADVMVSAHLRPHNFGTWTDRLSAGLWGDQWSIQTTNIASATVLVSALLLSLLAPGRWQRWAAAALAVYVTAPVIFPRLYSLHEYYWVATTAMLMSAIGLVLAGLWEMSTLPRHRPMAIVLILVGLQVALYFQTLYPQQLNGSPGGSRITQTLRLVTAPDDVLIIAGEDWSSMTPYYAQRRALMIRRDTEREWNRLEAGLDALHDEKVGALLLRGEQRNNLGLIERTVARTDIPSIPSLRFTDFDIFLPADRLHRLAQVSPLLQSWGAQLTPSALATLPPGQTDANIILLEGIPPELLEPFRIFSPLPQRLQASFGISSLLEGNKSFLGAHPDCSLWFRLPSGRHRTAVEIKFAENAYQADDLSYEQATDGVQVEWHQNPINDSPQTASQLFYSRYLNPRDVAADRGLVTIVTEVDLDPGYELELRITPGPHGALHRDWVSLGNVRID